MRYLFVTLPSVLLAGSVSLSRAIALGLVRWALHRRYDVAVEGSGAIDPARTYLILANHVTAADTLLLAAELQRLKVDVRRVADASRRAHPTARHLLALGETVGLNDFRRSHFRFLRARPTRADAGRRADAAAYAALATLCAGGNVLAYPSGRVTPDGREAVAGRPFAYGVVSRLPEGVRVLAVRVRGLYGSTWSRLGGRAPAPYFGTAVKCAFLWLVTGFRRKRLVTVAFEDVTARCREWSGKGLAAFNAELERWYGADLARIGRDREEAS